MSLESEAKVKFENHFNCAQSVFAPFAKRFDMDIDLAMKIATPLGGGMGHMGQVCGAVSGGVMALGLAKGSSEYDAEKNDACYALAQAFQERFIELHGDVTCPGLLGLDIGDPDDLQQVRDENLFHTLCPVFVGDAARIVGELLEIEAQ
jgi:C_GCAxxG_C_C family probable redox protein